MNVRFGGSFAMLLVTTLLVAIPLAVMFGLPHFASLSATTEPASDDIVRQPFSDVVTAVASPSSEPVTELPGDVPTSPARGGMSAMRDQQPQIHGRAPRPAPLMESAPLIDNHQADTRHGHGAPASPSRVPASCVVPSEEHAIAPSPMTAGSDSSWENAAQQLQEMGVDDYRLERGHNGDSYLFICQFAPGGDARIIQRFESEAAEPFDAVQQVLTQMGRWRERMESFPLHSR